MINSLKPSPPAFSNENDMAAHVICFDFQYRLKPSPIGQNSLAAAADTCLADKERPLRDFSAITLDVGVVQCCERLRQKGQIGRIPIKIQQRRRMLMRKFLDQQWMRGGFGGQPPAQPLLIPPRLLNRTVRRYENLEGK